MPETGAKGSLIADACLATLAIGSGTARIQFRTSRTRGKVRSRAGRSDEHCSGGPSGRQRTTAPRGAMTGGIAYTM